MQDYEVQHTITTTIVPSEFTSFTHIFATLEEVSDVLMTT